MQLFNVRSYKIHSNIFIAFKKHHYKAEKFRKRLRKRLR
jgi:hypothetical protein